MYSRSLSDFCPHARGRGPGHPALFVSIDESLVNFQSKNNLRAGDDSFFRVLETIFPFDADWIEKRNLKPGEARNFIYRIQKPSGPFTVDVQINYRNLPPYLLRALQLEELVDQLQVFTIDSKTVEGE